MPDTNYEPKRRASDGELAARRASDCVRGDQMAKAFVLNDLGEPDYDGHRRAHLEWIEGHKIVNGYKIEATKKVVGWVVVAILGAISAPLFNFLAAHIK